VIRRRVVGIFAALILIPQLMGASVVACAGNEDRDVANVGAPPEQLEGHQHHQSSGSGESTAPTGRHQLADCCPAMGACSGFAVGANTAALTTWQQHADALTVVATLSLSRVESPDPPPPRV
jgi:hypothetical protein